MTSRSRQAAYSRASALLQAMSRDIEEQRKEFNLTEYHQTYTRNAVAKLPKLSRRIVELAVKEMEESGYEFNKKRVGNVEQYALTIQNVIDIYAHRQIPKYRDVHKEPYVIFVVNLIDRNLNPQKTKKAPQNGCFFNTPC
ncbi:hypothetical protein OE181_25290, partial [Escherichia coli]|nr:hypothetical protein [Escherichia coli]